MAYIGQGIKNGTFTVLDTSGNTYNGSNVTFNLGTQVGSPAQLLVSHDGVIQKPVTDYTIATGGTQITFTTAPASGASIFITEISGAVGAPMNRDINGDELILDADADTSITADTDDQIDIRVGGTDQITIKDGALSPVTDNDIDLGTSSLEYKDGYFDGTLHCDVLDLAGTEHTSITNGITTASQWRLTTSATGDLEPIASNWEVNDTTGYGSLGSAMSESSGVFTFPSTGFWLITFICTWYLNGSSKWVEADIRTTTNNSSYTNASETYSHITQSESDTTYTTATAQTIFDVTNTSNCKVQFRSRVNNDSTTTYGSSSLNATGVTFVRLGDT